MPPSFTAVFAPASDPIPPSLIGEWKIDENKTELYLNPNGSYKLQLMNETRPGGIYDPCATFAFKTIQGSFTVDENKLTFHEQTVSDNDYASCSFYFTTPTSVPKSYSSQKSYVSSFSLLNNGQTLVLTGIEGGVDNRSQSTYQKYKS